MPEDPLTLGYVRLELTVALDLFSRSIVGWRFTPYSTTAVDAALILRDIITPKTMRPGWPESARWGYCGVPETIILDAFDVEDTAAIPTVHPETVVADHGKVYKPETFLRASKMLGINVQSTRPYTPTDKAQVERLFRTIETLLEELPGYKGPDVWSRGSTAGVEDEAFYWQLGERLGIHLRETLPAGCRKVHLFFSVPAALAFILGDSLRNVVPEIQLYEHDFEGRNIERRYYPSVKLPA